MVLAAAGARPRRRGDRAHGRRHAAQGRALPHLPRRRRSSAAPVTLANAGAAAGAGGRRPSPAIRSSRSRRSRTATRSSGPITGSTARQVDPAQVRQNDRLVVVLKVTEAEAKDGARAARRPAAGRLRDRQSEARRQRHGGGARLAQDATSSRRTPNSATTASSRPSTATPDQAAFFTVAYMVRAVAPGRYVHPPAQSRTCTAPSASAARPSARSRSVQARASDATSIAPKRSGRAAARHRRWRRASWSARSAVRRRWRCGASSTSSARSTCRRPRSARPSCSIATAGCCGPSRRRTGAGACRSRRRTSIRASSPCSRPTRTAASTVIPASIRWRCCAPRDSSSPTAASSPAARR